MVLSRFRVNFFTSNANIVNILDMEQIFRATCFALRTRLLRQQARNDRGAVLFCIRYQVHLLYMENYKSKED